jgi:hypothetical protein
MKTLQDKDVVLWLVALLVVISAIAIYRVGFHIPVPAFNKEAMKSLELKSSEAQTKPAEAKPTRSPESTIQPPQTADLKRELPTEDRFRSERPLYFRVVFGEQGNNSMLGMLDETGGTGAGYNLVYVDENRNGDLADDAAKKFPTFERGSGARKTDNPRFDFSGPFKNKASAKYTLNILSLPRSSHSAPGDYPFFWTLDTDGWNYFFIFGKMRLSSNAADALAGPPVRLAGPCKWQISSKRKSGKAVVSAGLKDENGCTLRSVRNSRSTRSPRLSLIKDGKVKAEERMKFG